MKKKLTKTIGLIVFVMFMNIFITNVNAVSGDVALTCVYDDKETIVLNITNSGSMSKSDSCTFNGDVYNWKKADKGGFKGQDYYLEHHECPPYAVYDVDTDFNIFAGYDEVYLAESESNAKSIKKKMIGARVIKLKEQIVGTDASDDVKDATKSNENIKKMTLPKKCECKESFDGTNISVTFDVSKSYGDPGRLTIKYGGSSDKESIQNWSKSKGGYNYVDDLVKNDKCPDYAVVVRGRGINLFTEGSYYLVLSDEDHLSSVKKAAGGEKQFALPCTDIKNKNENSNSNSNSNSSSNSNKTSTSNKKSNEEDPNVNSNVIRTLSYDVSTYSCGNEYMTGIPARIPKLGKFVMNFLQILIPIILIIYGSIDLVKAVYASKEDEIKKAQQTFVKRLVGSILIFFVFAIVKLVVSVVSKNSSPIMDCVDCILNYSDNCYEEE